ELTPGAGQAVLALRPGDEAVVRTSFFPSSISSRGFATVIPAGCAWDVGDEIDVVGPVGSAFNTPSRARRWLLASFEGPADRLMPLLADGLGQGVELALITPEPPPDLPAPVELNPAWAEAAAWADFLAWELPSDAEPSAYLQDRLRETRVHGSVQALVTPPMPCGIGACSACALRVRKGWALACRDGTVWDSHDLLG
ncbi:MAG: hypothetical protein WD040_01290, partial [Anaerolineales bacterium]